MASTLQTTTTPTEFTFIIFPTPIIVTQTLQHTDDPYEILQRWKFGDGYCHLVYSKGADDGQWGVWDCDLTRLTHTHGLPPPL